MNKGVKTVLVTGAAGYIGSVLTRILLLEGFRVVAVDKLLFGGESLLGVFGNPSFTFYHEDIRNNNSIEKIFLAEQIDAVAHLAAIVGDPACRIHEQEATETNLFGSQNLFQLAEKNGVKRFAFSSTCSNYGKMKETDVVTETSTLNPISHYARTKVEFEKYIFSSNGSMCATVLRFATVYGLSPRMRFDLTVNEFTRDLVLGKELEIFGAKFWRPYSHVEDLARSVSLVLSAEEKKVRNEIFNVGDNNENYQKGMILEEIRKVVAGSKIKYVESSEDPRDYRVNFDKIKSTLGFTITKKVSDGIIEIKNAIEKKVIAFPYDKKYSNT